MLLPPLITIVYLRRKFENVSIKLLELTCFNFSCKRIQATMLTWSRKLYPYNFMFTWQALILSVLRKSIEAF